MFDGTVRCGFVLSNGFAVVWSQTLSRGYYVIQEVSESRLWYAENKHTHTHTLIHTLLIESQSGEVRVGEEGGRR